MDYLYMLMGNCMKDVDPECEDSEQLLEELAGEEGFNPNHSECLLG
jgi:hypothetical protein